MADKSRARRQDDTGPRPSATTSQTPSAEAVMMGTVAGGLVLGALQSQERQPVAAETDIAGGPMFESSTSQGADEADPASTAPTVPAEVLQTAAPEVTRPAAPTETASISQPATAEPAAAAIPAAGGVGTPAPAETVQAAIAASSPGGDISPQAAEIATRIADQVSASVAKVLVTAQGANGDLSAVSLDVARDIAETARAIVADFGLEVLALSPARDLVEDIGPSMTGLAALPDAIRAEVATALDGGLGDLDQTLGGALDLPANLGETIARDVTEAVSGIGTETLASIGDLGGSTVGSVRPLTDGPVLDGLGGTSGVLGGDAFGAPLDTALAIPSSLLGNDGAEGSGGRLAEVFYSDGASEESLFERVGEGLAIPELSDTASVLTADLGDIGLPMLGTSYIDSADPGQSGGFGLNALSLL